MSEEIYKYKAYIATGATSFISFIFSLFNYNFPVYLIAPVGLIFAIFVCMYLNHRQLKTERKNADRISQDMITNAEKINAIICAAKQEERSGFEKTQKALDDMLAMHMSNMQKQYNEKTENIKRLEAQQSKMSEDMFNAAKELEEKTTQMRD
ncbi:hypothetical protein [Enterobacter chuandaensis]|uniref:Uncharacterized protein n=1 Tax=Enterobacter chuandaensis TaxID=2497875 RepID=A0AA96M0Y4_9ENTR|nr:hypothetical protein [Enterobacter chuandaensis]MCW4782497.1 hypothetical protein [Enterobacter chuandaensis]MDA4761761.1 hypothetical protein [Enterobacter chuandaensis]WNS36543.1 hypothetical protein RQP59_15815 [Enterobacter chuandaensis]